MTQATISELSALRNNLAAQIKAIDTIIGGLPSRILDPPIEKLMPPDPIPRVRLRPDVKPRGKSDKKAIWPKEDAVKFIIKAIKENEGEPMSTEDLAKAAPFESNMKSKVKAILAMTLTSLYYGEVLTRIKKYSKSGHLCYHYKFP